MIKIGFDAGHGLNTAGKRTPDGIREWTLNDKCRDKAAAILKDYQCTIINVDNDEGNTDETLAQRLNAYIKAGCDVFVSFHHNAHLGTWGTANGVETYTDKNPTAMDTKLANLVQKKLVAYTGLRNRGVKQADFYVINQDKITAVLVEGGFMDNKGDYAVITSDAGQTAYGKAVAESLIELYNIPKKSSNSSSTSVSAKEYKVIKEINKYSTAADAKAKTNSKGTISVGTYYIYTKYPNGYNGMYNITKEPDKAGNWINPSENVADTPTTTTQKLYRVRKSKDDAKSQVGAYASLDNAKDACQKAGAGYKVFDWDYKVVYEYTTPVVETPKQEEPTPVEPTPVEPTPTPKAVYDLDYPEKNLIVDKSISRTDKDCVKAIKKIVSNNSTFDINVAKAFFNEAVKYGIDPMMAISQSILETGWFKFVGSSVKPEQHNYCGLGATGGGVSGATFDTIEDGVHAQLQHLYAYGCKDDVPSGVTIVDPRFKYVTRGIAPYWQQLAGRWAVPGFDGSDAEAAMKVGTTYGQKIRSIYNTLNAVTVTDDEIEKWFPTEKPEGPEQEPTPLEPEKPVEPTPTDPQPVEPTDDTKVNSIVDIIIQVLKKLVTMLFKTFNKGDNE